MTFKKAKVVMLPTNEKAPISFQGDGKTLYTYGNLGGQNILPHNNQHLYFLSDDEIKEGDWYYDSMYRLILQATSTSTHKGGNNYKKIIATTDKLNINPNIVDAYRTANCLPQIPQSFVEYFVSEYNKGNIITKIIMEYEPFKITIHTGIRYEEKLKVNPKDNTITIRKIKDSWSREEVITLLQNCWSDSAFNLAKQTKKEEFITFTKWIEENL